MKSSNSLVALALLATACGRPLPSGISSDETESGEDSTTITTTTTSAPTPSSSESDSGDDDDATESLGFVAVPDHACWFPCDLVLQDCADGEKCVPQSGPYGGWYSPMCVPVIGDRAPGESCTFPSPDEFTDDCDATGFCWDVTDGDGEAIGVCHSFCLESFECAEEMHACVQFGQDGPHVCLPACDPVLQDCGEGLGCFWADTAFTCASATQDIAQGQPCGYVNDCSAGTGCLPAEVMPSCLGSACCSPFCQVGGDDLECAVLPGTTCVPFFEQGQAPPGYDHVGVCILP